ncbi:glycoside hydrolase family 2 protein [Cognatitamlana onchidii]|uniref:glycoside hydrolase family 2 protein n=1 Tax=Cognatitamlana onchidii TaxID=2562860 RepID=UPI001F308E9B|nr:glycoside hydrolase family 2 TIM barrel-domain containing protein [Algibacter onchidii]
MGVKKEWLSALRFMLIMLVMVSVSCSKGADKVVKRTKQNINSGWLYLENNLDDLNEVLNQDTWDSISLPHSWNALDATDITPGYRRSASWYKKDLNIENKVLGQRYMFYFEGVNIESKVYLNGKEVGGHVGGYIGYKIDVTETIHQGNNELLVRADNGYNPEIIPSQKSDFFIYGGITRDVWLETVPETYLENVKITTPKVSKASAQLNAVVTINSLESNENLEVKASLIDADGKQVVSSLFRVKDGVSQIVFSDIKDPLLWHTNTPNLYTLQVELLEDNVSKDKTAEKFGFRWFEFKDYGAFYLNGERLLLRGTHRHEEHAGVGAAMSNKQHRADMELIKDMGANFVRLAHYPQDPEVYKACDELGLLVWDELPWCRGGVGNDKWKENTKGMLQEIIQQNFNHPSIILWSLGNEIYWLPDFEGGDDRTEINSYLEELNDLAHHLDPSRKTAIRKYYEGADIVDVFSPSIWSGWYSGSYKSYQKAIDQYKQAYPHFLHAEYGGSSHVGRHTENPITGEGKIESDGWEEAIVQTDVANIAQIGDWSENYIVDLFDWHLRISESDSTLVGNIQWAFKDFGTPLRPENAIPYMNQKGLVDRSGNPKDAFYVFKSYWSDVPFTYIESHTWKERQGPEGKERTVSVYSNCKEVELFHNGKSLGKKQRNTKLFPAAGLNWEVHFVNGKNNLEAIGVSKNDSQVTDDLVVNYRFTKNEKARALKLHYSKLSNGNYLVTATAIDNKGLRCLDYEERVYFQCLNGGEAISSHGTPTGSEIIEMANGQASIELRPDAMGHAIQVMVLNQSFKGTYLTIQQ